MELNVLSDSFCLNRKNITKQIVVLFVLFLFPILSFADEDIVVKSQFSQESYAPGDTILLGIDVTIPSKYHLYGNPLGPGIGKAISFKKDLNNNIKWLDILMLPAKKFTPITGDWVWAYEKHAYFFLRGILSPDVIQSIKGTLELDGLICHTACIPVNKRVEYSIRVDKNRTKTLAFAENASFEESFKNATEKIQFESIPDLSMPLSGLNGFNLKKISTVSNHIENSKTPVIPSAWNYSPREKKIEFNIWIAIAMGFIAGIILNFMPCVLPVLGIKVLSLSHAEESGLQRSAIIRSIAFATGILLVFMILASLASFANFSWGEQFQEPRILIGIIVLIVVFALWMFDIFMINITGAVTSIEKRSTKNGLWGDFFRGVFATILATPCSGPFLGATLAWALTQNAIIIFTVFIAIGLGMSCPYVILSINKNLMRLIPKPGKWMNDFKVLMGFILIGFAVYLMIGLPQNMIISTIGVCVFITFAIVFYSRFATWDSLITRKLLFAFFSLLIAASGVYLCFGVLYKSISYQTESKSEVEGQWKMFSVDLLKKAHMNKQHVIVDFTASWCMNCQYNKIAVLNSEAVRNSIKKKNVLLLKADITTPNPEIESLMQNLGSRSVPFLAIFPGDNPYAPIVMRDVLSKKAVVTVLNNLANKN